MRWACAAALFWAIAGCTIETGGLKAVDPDARPAAVDGGRVIPPRAEVCDGVDNDGDPATVDGSDDADVGISCDGSDDDLCEEGTSTCVGGRVVCDDLTDNTHETCNGVDDDCDGAVDEQAIDAVTYYPDADGDGFGTDASTEVGCEPPPDHATVSDDCDDGDPTVSPGATETCNLVDDDCDGTIDDASPTCGCVGHTLGARIYLFCRTDATFDEAESDCVARGGHLASVLSMGEHELLKERVAFYADEPWWIGYTDAGTEGSWVWTDRSPAGFTAWGSGEPNDGGSSWWRDEDCATMNTFGDRTWNDAECDQRYPYVCKLP